MLPPADHEQEWAAPSAGTDQIGDLIAVLREIAGHLSMLVKAGMCAAPLTFEERLRARSNYYNFYFGKARGSKPEWAIAPPTDFEKLDAVERRWWLDKTPVPANPSAGSPNPTPEAK
jgi:hypothetical protein